MAEFDLAASATFSGVQGGMDIPIRLAPDRHAVSLVREYMLEDERRHQAAPPAAE